MMLASGIGGVIVLRPRLGGGKPGTDGTFLCDFSDSSRNTPLTSAGTKGAGPLDRNVVWVEVPVERNRSRLDLNQGGRSCRSCARPWFGLGEIVCAVRSRPMRPMWAVSHKASADVAQIASLSWQSPSKCCPPRGSAACACSKSTTCQEPAWFRLFRAQLNLARKCAPTDGRVTTGYPVKGTHTTQPASPKAETQPMFPCPVCTRWLPSSNAGCSEPTRDR